MRKKTQWRRIGKSNWYRRYNAKGILVKTQLSKAAAKTRNKIIDALKFRAIEKPFLDFFNMTKEFKKAVFEFRDFRFDVNSLKDLYGKMRQIIKTEYETGEIDELLGVDNIAYLTIKK